MYKPLYYEHLEEIFIFLAGLVGLAISYALTITSQLSGLVTSFTETEKQMVSVERAMQYVSGVPREVDGLAIVSSPFVSLSVCLSRNAVY
jgi:ATP-binding cassette subfamily C (CFTR/MRP) protein 10